MVSSDNFFGDAARVAGNGRDPRDAVIARELESARAPALAAALEAFALLKLLPRAFADSQRRELQRVQASDDNGKDSPRVQRLLHSIEQAETLRGTSELGLARVERMLSLQGTDARLLHGFVSDSQLRPLSKLRVQLQLDNDKPRSASTGEDGYFRIELGDRKSKADVGSLAALLARGTAGAKVDAKNAQVNAAAAAAPTPGGSAGKLSIHDANGTLLYADPDAIALDAGTVYREYLISGEAANDGDPPPPPKGRTATGTTANDTKAKDAATATTQTAASAATREAASSAATKAADPAGTTADTRLAEAKPAATATTRPATKTVTKATAAKPALEPRASAPKGPAVARSRKAPATPPKGRRK
jgi:hypothetical protein